MNNTNPMKEKILISACLQGDGVTVRFLEEIGVEVYNEHSNLSSTK